MKCGHKACLHYRVPFPTEIREDTRTLGGHEAFLSIVSFSTKSSHNQTSCQTLYFTITWNYYFYLTKW